MKDLGTNHDGYHTFNELYDHRFILWLNICAANSSFCSWKPHYEGWFLLEMKTEYGQISYHLPNRLLPIVEKRFKRDDSTIWDGHTSDDVLNRLSLRFENHFITPDTRKEES